MASIKTWRFQKKSRFSFFRRFSISGLFQIPEKVSDMLCLNREAKRWRGENGDCSYLEKKEEAVETYHGFFFIGGIFLPFLHHATLRDHQTINATKIFVQLRFRGGSLCSDICVPGQVPLHTESNWPQYLQYCFPSDWSHLPSQTESKLPQYSQ